MSTNRPFLARAWRLAGGVSVRSKILGIILGLTLVLGLGVTVQVRRTMSRTLGHELEQRGISVARDLAARSADPILIHDTYALYQLLTDTVSNNPDVRYAFIVDENDQVLVHAFVEDGSALDNAGFPLGLIDANRASIGERQHRELLETNEGLIHDFAVPLFDGRAGTARIGLSEDRMQNTVNVVTGQLLLTTVAVAIVGLIAATFLTWILTRPIIDLVSVTNAVARGDLSMKARTLADDEIGRLGGAFNLMVDDLAVAQAKSRAYDEELLQRNRELAVLNSIAAAASGPLDLETLLERALERMLSLLGYEAGWVMLMDRPDGTLNFASAVGFPGHTIFEQPLSGGDVCPCRQVLETKQPLVVSPLEDRCPLASVSFSDNRVVSCHAAVPLVMKSRALGILNIAGNHSSQFGEEDLQLLRAIGTQLSVAIENAQLWEELKVKEALRGQLLDKVISAQEEERKRIARGLHDETSQALTSFMVGLKVLEGANSVEEARRQAAELRRTAASALEDVRNLALELRPSMLDDMGLIPALERYTREFAEKTGLTVDYHAVDCGGLRLLPRVETAVYRIVQESLANVMRHAAADTVGLLLDCRANQLVAIVEDDGRGFDADRLLRSGSLDEKLGLFGMQERAGLVGGELTIESSPGSGTTVFLSIPVDESQVH